MQRDQNGLMQRLSHLFVCAGLALTLQAAPPARAGDNPEHGAFVGSMRSSHRSAARQSGGSQTQPPRAVSHGSVVKLPDIGYDQIPEMPWPLVAPPADQALACEGDCAGAQPARQGVALGHRGIDCIAGCYTPPAVLAALETTRTDAASTPTATEPRREASAIMPPSAQRQRHSQAATGRRLGGSGDWFRRIDDVRRTGR